jgi:methylmalonyl-CoA mutase cobalamin-binding subunit
MAELERRAVIPESELTPAEDLLGAGRALAETWRVGPSEFLKAVGEPSEAAYKRAQAAAGRIMRHAQIGYRDPEKNRRAYGEIYGRCESAGARIDRYGLCLDWSMGYPRARREEGVRGTGMILEGPEDFARLSAAAPVAPHFGDFVLGFPAAVENTQGALAAGSTAIGNLGQYFTFRLPGWHDDVAATGATVTALGLIAAQPVEILVHSNLDDGFAAVMTDLSCALGAALLERYIVDELIGARVAHCFGHHFSDPMTRLAFQIALQRANPTPGTMIYGNTVSYRGDATANYASLASYLLVDILGQRLNPSGHAVNPVPVTENRRIPDIDEVVEAQLFADRLIAHAPGHLALIDPERAEALAERLLAGAATFKERVLAGLAEGGFAVGDAAELLLALRRIGGKRLEELFGPGAPDAEAPRGRKPLVPAGMLAELEDLAEERLAAMNEGDRAKVAAAGLCAVVATTDVHEHGKLLVEQVLQGLGVNLSDGGVSIDPDDLARAAKDAEADIIAISTYNGIALSFMEDLKAELARLDLDLPVLIGGRLNQIPPGSNTSLPVEVTDELSALGAVVCREVEDALPVLVALANARGQRQ